MVFVQCYQGNLSVECAFIYTQYFGIFPIFVCPHYWNEHKYYGATTLLSTVSQ